MAEGKTRLVDAGELRGLMERLLMAEGAEEEAAHMTAEVHWEAQLRGHTSHGVVRIPPILGKLRDGTTNAAAKPRVIREKEATALVDGDGGLGPFVSFFAAGIAVRKARRAGSCAVGVVNTNHWGFPAVYGERIAREGLAAVLAAVTNPMVHPFGGMERVIGTNPLVIAVPSDSGPPLVHDFATSAIANGKVMQAQMRGENLPEGVALGPDGLPTRDPAAARKGSLAPMGEETGGGHKGFGLGLCIGLLAGPLVGAMTGKAAIGGYEPGKRSNEGEIIIAMDPVAFGDPAEFFRAVGVHLAEVRDSRKAHGSEGIRIPGERGFAERERRLEEGVPVDGSAWADLGKEAARLGVPMPA